MKGEVLGVITDLTPEAVPEGSIATLSLSGAKKDKYIANIDAVEALGVLLAAPASKIAGQGQYAVSVVWHRGARAFMWPLYNKAHGNGPKSDGLTQAERFALRGLRALHKQAKPRCVRSIASPTHEVTLILDACGSKDGLWGSECLGALLLAPNPRQA